MPLGTLEEVACAVFVGWVSTLCEVVVAEGCAADVCALGSVSFSTWFVECGELLAGVAGVEAELACVVRSDCESMEAMRAALAGGGRVSSASCSLWSTSKACPALFARVVVGTLSSVLGIRRRHGKLLCRAICFECQTDE